MVETRPHGPVPLAAEVSPLIAGDDSITTVGRSIDIVDLASHARQAAERWLFSRPMRRLLSSFGADLDDVATRAVSDAGDWLHLNEELPSWIDDVLQASGPLAEGAAPALDTLQRAINLERWAATQFNFRSQDGVTYKERNQALSGAFDDETRSAVLEEAAELGLVRATRPRYDTYDYTLVLGGGWRSPLLRARYAAHWERTGTSLGHLYFLGSPRFLVTDPPERDQTESYAPGAVDEFDLMRAAASREFEVDIGSVTLLCGCSTMEEICPRWRHTASNDAATTPSRYTHERSVFLTYADGDRRGTVLSASTSRPPYRPDTTDTLGLWARQANPQAGERALIVTTQVFVPFQTFDSLKRIYLGQRVDVDVIGYSADWGDRPDNPEYLLQETLSAIRSARRMLIEAVALLVHG